jgi:hypothetical protein
MTSGDQNKLINLSIEIYLNFTPHLNKRYPFQYETYSEFYYFT